MKKVLKLTEIDCANCAARMERGIKRIEGIQSAAVSFITKKVVVNYSDECDFDSILKLIKAEVKKVEPDCEVKC